MAIKRDPHCGPVPPDAWHADAVARERGRVEIFNATRPGGLDKWTMDLRQYELMRSHILEILDDEAGADGTVTFKQVVESAQDRYATHELFPTGRVRNYCTFTKVDMEARCETSACLARHRNESCAGAMTTSSHVRVQMCGSRSA